MRASKLVRCALAVALLSHALACRGKTKKAALAEGPSLDRNASAILDKIGELESKKDVTCWTSFRQLDWYIAEKSYSEFGTLAKIGAIKALVRATWAKASLAARGAEVTAADLATVKLPAVAVPAAQKDKLPQFANDIGLQNFTDYQKTSEQWRSLLAVVEGEIDAGGTSPLKPLADDALGPLSDDATTLSLLLLKESGAAAAAAHKETIDGEEVQTAYKKILADLGLANPPRQASPLSQAEVKARLQPLTEHLIDGKIASLNKFNKTTGSLTSDLNKVTRIPLTDDAADFLLKQIQSFDIFVTSGMDPMQADNYLSDGSFARTQFVRVAYLSDEQVENAVMQIFPHEMEPNGDILVRYEPNPGPVTDAPRAAFEVKLLGHEMDGVRDSAVHWLALKNVFKDKPFAIDPFAAEYLSEVNSMMMTLFIRRAEVIAKEMGKTEIDREAVARVQDPAMVLVPPHREVAAAWTPERQAAKAKLLAAYHGPLFRDASASSGLPTRFPQFEDLTDVKGHVEPREKPADDSTNGQHAGTPKGPATKDVKGHVEPSTKDVKGHVEPSTKDVKGHVEPDTKGVQAHVEPSTKGVQGHVEPSTKDVKGHVEPDTKGVQAHVEPSTKGVQGHVEPSTQGVQGHTAPASVQGYFNIQKIMGGGIAVGDVNGDGYPDLFMTGEALGRLYLNRGKAAPGKFTDATKAYGLPEDLDDGHGTLLFDLDGDGDLDLLILRSEHPSMLLIQDHGKFTDRATELGFVTHRGAHVATAFDYDRDGDLDLYVGYYGNDQTNQGTGERNLPSLDGRNGSPNQLFRQGADGKLTEVAAQAGVADPGWALALGAFDYDRDGDDDLFIANDFGADTFYRNNGDGTFTDITTLTGTGDRGSGMNVDFTDVNHDGLWDLYVTDIDMFSKRIKVIFPRDESTINLDESLVRAFQYLSGNKLYVSTGKPDHPFEPEELTRFEPGDRGWGWDAAFFDYENDGDDDLYLCNGWITGSYAGDEKKQMFLDDGGFFYLASPDSPEAFAGNARSAAAVDLDLDGDVDLVVNNFREPPRVFENVHTQANHWVKLRLAGKGKNPRAIGAVVEIHAGDLTVLRQLQTGRGYLSEADPWIDAGVGAARTVDLKVRWPDGKTSEHKAIATDKLVDLAEP